MNGSRDWIDNFAITQSTAAAAAATSSESAQPEVKTPKDGGVSKKAAAVSSTWIAYNPASTHKRKDVRVHAAKASAAARKATIASKEAKRRQQVKSKASRLATELWNAANSTTTVATTATVPTLQAVAIITKAAEDKEPLQKLLMLVTQLQDGSPRRAKQHGEAALAYGCIRTMMWDAMTGNTTLFQVAIFVAGTHSNTCGIPRTAFKEMGPGLVALRGASLDAIQAAVTASDADNVTPMAIALLAGWERRFGDAASYDVHMLAWRRLSLPAPALDPNNVSSLTEVILEIYRTNLGERSIINPDDSIARSGSDPYKRLTSLPVGLRSLDMNRSEARSLLALVARFADHDIKGKGAVARIRAIGLENMAWSPTHTQSVEPLPLCEEEMDQLELSALYHIRAACISLGGLIMQATMVANNVTWLFDLQAALYLHTISCPHLRTDVLLGTKYGHLALWARFSICAIARDPLQDDNLKYLLQRFGITSWADLRPILTTFLYPEALCEPYMQALYKQLTTEPETDGHEMLPTPDSLISTSNS